MQLTEARMLDFLTQLEFVFKRPDHSPPRADMARIYSKVLHDLSDEAVDRAVATYIREDHSFFPKPGKLRVIAEMFRHRSDDGKPLQRAYNEWVHGPGMGEGEPCPVCNSALEVMPNERLNMRHDHQRHYEADVGYHGPRTGTVGVVQTEDDGLPF